MLRVIVLVVWVMLLQHEGLSQKRQTDTLAPNIIFIVADDLGWADVGYNGSTLYKTPNIDKLAGLGIVFNCAYSASPVCSPSRAALLTGKHPVQTDITDYIPGDRHYGPHTHQKLASQPFAMQLPLAEHTLAEALKKAGYRTFFAGKWHLGENENFGPLQHGFDKNLGGNHTGHPAGGYFSPYQNPQLPDGPNGEYLTDRLTDETMAFIRQNDNRPFFAFMPYYSVHLPLQGKPDTVEKYRQLLTKKKAVSEVFEKNGDTYSKLVQNNPQYAAMVESLDENIGRLMNFLQTEGLARNTIIIFTSDNGGMSTSNAKEQIPTSNLPLRAGKGYLYEGGIRVPLVISWQANLKGGQHTNFPVSGMDFYPTLLQLAGLPPMPQQHIDGISLVPLLSGKSLAVRSLFWHYPHYSGGLGGTPAGAVRMGRYKLIEWYESNTIELYNLDKDAGEKVNLATSKPQQTRKLRQMLHRWRHQVKAKMPHANPNYKVP
ncbi:MAG: DUF4976 domain-containing protein [Bacteroidetes bacterium]|nr:MAG: DUF4976 domain-containing protein [Bacteroidota bacterium]